MPDATGAVAPDGAAPGGHLHLFVHPFLHALACTACLVLRADASGALVRLVAVPARRRRVRAVESTGIASRALQQGTVLAADAADVPDAALLGLDPEEEEGRLLAIPYESMFAGSGVILAGGVRDSFTPWESTVAGALGHWWALSLDVLEGGGSMGWEVPLSFLADRVRDLTFAGTVVMVRSTAGGWEAVARAGAGLAETIAGEPAQGGPPAGSPDEVMVARSGRGASRCMVMAAGRRLGSPFDASHRRLLEGAAAALGATAAQKNRMEGQV